MNVFSIIGTYPEADAALSDMESEGETTMPEFMEDDPTQRRSKKRFRKKALRFTFEDAEPPRSRAKLPGIKEYQSKLVFCKKHQFLMQYIAFALQLQTMTLGESCNPTHNRQCLPHRAEVCRLLFLMLAFQ